MTLEQGTLVPYYLEEENNWSLPKPEDLRQLIHHARDDGTIIRSMCVINPGNPTGQVLKKQCLEDVIKLCWEENIMLMGDEVY